MDEQQEAHRLWSRQTTPVVREAIKNEVE